MSSNELLTGNNPVILYPSVKDVLPDWGFVSGTTGTGSELWRANGTGLTMTTGQGELLGYSMKFDKTGGNACYADMSAVRYVPFLITGTGLSPNYYIRMKATAATGIQTFDLTASYYDSAGAFISDATTMSINIGVDIQLNTWSRLRRTLAAIPSNTAGIKFKFGFTAAGGSVMTIYVDWVAFAFDLNFADLGPGATGAYAANVFPWRKEYKQTRQGAADGTQEVQLWNNGLLSGEFKTTLFNDAGRANVRNFVDYATRGAPFTVWLNQDDFTYNYTQRAIPDEQIQDDGISQFPGTSLHEWEWKYKEVI